MSDVTTKIMLKAYSQSIKPTMFFTGQFNNVTFHNSEKVEIDIERDDEDVSIAVSDLSTGARLNSADVFTNKEFKPPIHKEKAVLNAFDLIKRNAGEDPYKDVDFQANAVLRGVKLGQKLSPKIMRSVELQASQILTTGTVSLKDEVANVIYSISFSPKATHFPTVSTSWGTASATPIDDLLAVCEAIRDDGLVNADMLVFGQDAYEKFINDDTVKPKLDFTRLAGSGIVPMQRLGNGGTYRGTVEIGNYKLDMYTYNGRYKDPQTGNKIKFLADDKVIIRDSMGRLDATFGGIPKVGRPDPRVPSELFQRVTIEGSMFDMQHWASILGNNDGLEVEVGTRPLLIPVAIDTFGCLTVTAP